MITIRTQPWNNIDTGKNHILTSYQVGQTEDFSLATNILAEVNGDANNKMLNIGVINIDMPIDTVWYTRFKRTFDDGTSEDSYSIPEAVYSRYVNNNKFIKTSSLIAKPSIKVEDMEAYLNIDSSVAKIDGMDGHLYTTVLIYSGSELVFKNLKDEDNLNNLKIPLTTLNYKALNQITVCVIYGTSNGTESPVARVKLNISRLKYKVEGKFDNIPYNRNTIYLLTSEDNNVVVSTAFLYNGAGENLGEYHALTFLNKQSGLNRYTEIYVDSEHFIPNTIYTLRLHLANSSDSSVSEIKNYVITTEKLDEGFVVDKKYKYSTTEFKYFNNTSGVLPIPSSTDNFTISHESNYKDILLTSTAEPNSLSKMKFYPNSLELLVSKELDLNISTVECSKVVFFTKDKKCIVALAIPDGVNFVLRIVVFNYNPYNEVVLSKISTTNFSTIPNVKKMIESNAIAISDDEKHLYCLTNNSSNESEFVRIDLETKAMEVLAKRADTLSTPNLINVGGNKFLSSKGNLNFNSFYIYDSESNIWSAYQTLYPVDINFANCNVGILRKDGKILFLNLKGMSGKYQLVFNAEEKTFEEITLADVPSNYVVSNIIRETNGTFIIVLDNEFDTAEKALLTYY